MAIDMTTVKQIMHNNKEVVKIENGLGKVLWQKEAGPQWHTLWSGSAYAKVYTTSRDYHWRGSVSDTNVLATIPLEAMASGCKLRITWSYSWGESPSSSSRYYLKNNSSSSSVPAKPYIIDTTSLGTITHWKLLGLLAYGDMEVRYQGGAYLRWNSNTRELSLSTSYNSGQAIGYNYSAQFTLTKIEAYY